MKVLYYSAHPNLVLNAKSGYGTHMREMIKAFRLSGFEVEPVIMGGIDEQDAAFSSSSRRYKGLMRSLLPPILWESFKDASLLKIDRHYAAILEQKIKEIKPDVIYERAAYMQLSGVRMAKKYGIPHVLEMNSPYIIERKVRHGTGSLMTFKAKQIEREQLVLSDVPVVISPALKKYFEKQHALDGSRIICTHNAIDPSLVKSDSERVQEIRLRYQLGGDQVVGFVGSLNKYQRVDLLIEAAGQLVGRYPGLKFLIVGDNTGLGELKKLCERLSIKDRVIFTGKVPHEDVFNFIEAMDITVLPDNLWYGSPTKIFEYGAMGKVVVAPDNETMRDLIENGKEGLLSQPKANSIAEAISFLLDHPKKRQEMACAFKQKVHTQYTWMQNVRDVLQAIDFDTKHLEYPVYSGQD